MWFGAASFSYDTAPRLNSTCGGQPLAPDASQPMDPSKHQLLRSKAPWLNPAEGLALQLRGLAGDTMMGNVPRTRRVGTRGAAVSRHARKACRRGPVTSTNTGSSSVHGRTSSPRWTHSGPCVIGSPPHQPSPSVSCAGNAPSTSWRLRMKRMRVAVMRPVQPGPPCPWARGLVTGTFP